jgi:hypothetical protein
MRHKLPTTAPSPQLKQCLTQGRRKAGKAREIHAGAKGKKGAEGA